MYNDNMGKYDDIIERPYVKSNKHPHMSMEQRAAQFSPFAALVGYDEELYEETRLTDEKFIMDEDREKELDYILSHLSDGDEVSVTYFVPDLTKAGGAYKVSQGNIRRIDKRKKLLCLSGGEEILFGDIYDIEEVGVD